MDAHQRQRCQLQESRWKQSKLEACIFSDCDLSRAELQQTGLRDVRFEGSNNPELAFDNCVLRYKSR